MTKEMRINSFLDAGLLAVSADKFPNPTGRELVVSMSFEEVASTSCLLAHYVLGQLAFEARWERNVPVFLSLALIDPNSLTLDVHVVDEDIG